MADLVADHVGLREIAGAAETREVGEESGVEIDTAIGRTVERPDRRGRITACRLHGAVEQRELGRFVTAAGRREDFAPNVLRAAEDRGHELARLVVGAERLTLLRARRFDVAATAEQRLQRFGPADQVHDDEQRGHAEPAAAERDRDPGPHSAAALFAPDVADVVAAPQALPAHGGSPYDLTGSLTERRLSLNGDCRGLKCALSTTARPQDRGRESRSDV